MGINLGNLIGGPLVQGILGLISIYEQKKLQGEWTGDVEAQIQQAMQQAGVTSEQVQAAYDKSAARSQDYAERAANRQVLGANQNVRATEKSGNELLAGIGARGARLIGGMRADEADILGGLLADEADILKGYGDRYTFTEGELKGFGGLMKMTLPWERGKRRRRL